MRELTTFEPWGARLLASEEVERQLALVVGLYDHLAENIPRHGPDFADRHRAEAQHYRELRSSVTPGDRVWLLTEPPDHRDFVQGTAYLVIVRGGKLVAKQRLIRA